MPASSGERFPFPRTNRLLRARDFRAVFQNAERVSDRHFTVLFCRGSSIHARLGMAVPKRAVPRAVDRNRIKRQVRESFRLNRSRLPPMDVVVLARAAARSATGPDLKQALGRLWQRVLKRCEGQSSC
nr:ribonuclease P protein component [Natronocella acetinitrilica]